MKKVLSFMLMLAVSVAASAQLKVDQLGRIAVGDTSPILSNGDRGQMVVEKSDSANFAAYFKGNVWLDNSWVKGSLFHYGDLSNGYGYTNMNSFPGYSWLGRILNLQVYTSEEIPGILNPINAGDGGRSLPGEMEAEELFMNSDYFINGQNMQSEFPTLVTTDGHNHYLVNYAELVPVLVQAIKELNAKITLLSRSSNESSMDDSSAAYQQSPSTSGVNRIMATASRSVLYQNTPNPFKEQTVIRFRLADDVQTAAVCIFDMQGKLLKKMPVSQGMESVTVNGYELGEGMFLYSLLVNGQEIDTKRMILSK